MAVLTGGIFSRPRGKTGGIVFGAARTRQGKLVTSRLLVPPSNPNTAAQQTQRSIFSSALSIVRKIGSAIYRTDWNRAIGQLPGFQSMQSIFMTQMDSDLNLSLTTPINLGILHFPNSFSASASGTDEITVTFSTEVGDNGTDTDKIKILAIAKSETDRQKTNGVVVNLDAARNDGDVTIPGLVAGATYELYAYLEGDASASGLLSVANPFEVTLL